MSKKPKLGSGKRFEKLTKEIEDEDGKSADDAKAIAASIGRKKYGKEKFQKMASEGKSKKAVVLKSLRTLDGANEWIRVMGVEGATVVDTITLKGFGSIDGWDDEMSSPPHHVIIESDMTPVIEKVKEGDITEIVKEFISCGYMEANQYGVSFTEKWYKLLDSYVSGVMEDAFKSVDGANVNLSVSKLREMPVEAHNLLHDLSTAIKSVADSEALAAMTGATENAETGHALRPNVAISDAEAKSLSTVKKAPAANLEDKQAMPEGISDSEADTQTRKSVPSAEDVQGTAEPESADDEAASKAVAARAEKEDDYEDAVGTSFKSLAAAQAWQKENTDANLYVDTPTFQEKLKIGRNKAYIVRRRAAREPIGMGGNRLVR